MNNNNNNVPPLPNFTDNFDFGGVFVLIVIFIILASPGLEQQRYNYLYKQPVIITDETNINKNFLIKFQNNNNNNNSNSNSNSNSNIPEILNNNSNSNIPEILNNNSNSNSNIPGDLLNNSPDVVINNISEALIKVNNINEQYINLYGEVFLISCVIICYGIWIYLEYKDE